MTARFAHHTVLGRLVDHEIEVAIDKVMVRLAAERGEPVMHSELARLLECSEDYIDHLVSHVVHRRFASVQVTGPTSTVITQDGMDYVRLWRGQRGG